MIPPTSKTTDRFRLTPRWLLAGLLILLVGVAVLLLAALLRNAGPESEVWLRITPVASTLDEAATIMLSSGGWRDGEQVAICLNKPDDRACDAALAVLVETADPDGNLQVAVPSREKLAEGRTTFVARGLASDRDAVRAFRVLRASGDSVASGASTPAPGAAPQAPPADQQPPEPAPAANNGIEAGNVATVDPAIDPFPDWRGEYFTNPDLAGEPALVRNDPDPNLDWGAGSPAPDVIPPDGFSVRWSRSLNFAPGVYRFVLTAQDGGRLLVEGQPVIDAWQQAEIQTITVDQALSGGQYQIVVHFRNLSGPASLRVGWSPLATATPVQVAGVEPSPTPSLIPTPQPTATPDGLAAPTATAINGIPATTPTTATSTPESGATSTPDPAATSTPDPGATSTPEPSVTAGATETSAPSGSVTPGTTPAGTPTVTPTATPLPPVPVGAVERIIEINPSIGPPGQSIQINSGNWTPGTVLRVSLGERNTPYGQTTLLPGVTFTTPLDSSQAWSFRFTYPNESPWSNPTLPVYVWVHNANWSEWARDIYDIERP